MAREDVKKQIAIAVALFSIVSVILVLIGGVSYFSIKGTQEKEAQKYMKEIVSQYKNIIRAQIDGDIQTLDAVAAITGQDGAVDLDTVLSYLEEECSHNDFIHMGFVYPDRKGYFIDTDGNRHDGVDISDEDFISRTLSKTKCQIIPWFVTGFRSFMTGMSWARSRLPGPHPISRKSSARIFLTA